MASVQTTARQRTKKECFVRRLARAGKGKEEKRRKVRNKHKENKVSSARTCHGEKRCGDKRKKKEKRREKEK